MVKKGLTRRRGLFVAIDPLAALVALLGFDRQRCDRPCFGALERDRVAGLLAVAVSAVRDSRQRCVDLRDQLALPIAGTELDGAVGFRRCAIGKVGMILA